MRPFHQARTLFPPKLILTSYPRAPVAEGFDDFLWDVRLPLRQVHLDGEFNQISVHPSYDFNMKTTRYSPVVRTASDIFQSGKLPIIEDPKARHILDQMILYDGEVEIGKLKTEVVKEKSAMSRTIFYEKLNMLESEGVVSREARMEGNRAVAYIVAAGPFLDLLGRRNSNQFQPLSGRVMETLKSPGISDEEKEKFLAELLKAFMGGNIDWVLDVVEECIRADGRDKAAQILSLSGRYLFVLYLTEVGLLFRDFREHGIEAVRMVREFFNLFREEGRRE